MNSSQLRLRLTRLFAIGVLVTFASGATYWANANPVTEKTLLIIGLTLAGFGASGRAWAISHIAGKKRKQLVRTGPYSLCRNPLYFFNTVLGIGLGFCTATLTIPLLIAAVLMVVHHFQIRGEEEMLHNRFGYDFEAYAASVPRFFPSFRNYQEPDEILVSPRLLRQGLFGIGFLLILIGVLELFEGMHQSGILPTHFRIY